jgi:hypothetical protein
MKVSFVCFYYDMWYIYIFDNPILYILFVILLLSLIYLVLFSSPDLQADMEGPASSLKQVNTLYLSMMRELKSSSALEPAENKYVYIVF